MPLKRMEKLRGIEVEMVEAERGIGGFREKIEGCKMVAFSSVSYRNGLSLPTRGIVELANENEVYSLLDAAQSIGQKQLEAGSLDADFIAAPGHKWCLGPQGAGFLYCSEEMARRSVSSRVGHRGAEALDHRGNFRYKEGARRFEIGNPSPANMKGFAKALENLSDIGVDNIERRIERLTSYFREQLEDSRLDRNKFRSGILKLQVSEAEKLRRRLIDSGIWTAVDTDEQVLRLSIHAFNTQKDIDALLEHL